MKNIYNEKCNQSTFLMPKAINTAKPKTKERLKANNLGT